MYKDIKVNTRTYRMRVSYRRYILSLLYSAWIGVAPFLFTAVMWLILWVIVHALVEKIS